MARILIVDDEPDLVNFLAEEFKVQGLDVDTALNADAQHCYVATNVWNDKGLAKHVRPLEVPKGAIIVPHREASRCFRHLGRERFAESGVHSWARSVASRLSRNTSGNPAPRVVVCGASRR